MSENVDKIIERVQKLLALAGNNSNEHEAAAAIEKAYAILAEHNLSLATIEQAKIEGEEQDERGALKTETNFSEKYYAWLWNEVARLHFCRSFMNRPSSTARQTYYTLVGRKVNAIVATQLAMYLCQSIRRIANDEAKRQGRKDFAFKNAFLYGAALRLIRRIEELRKQGNGSANALVLWRGDEDDKNAAYIKDVLNVNLLPAKRRKAADVDPSGYHAGYTRANEISLNAQLDSRKATEEARFVSEQRKIGGGR